MKIRYLIPSCVYIRAALRCLFRPRLLCLNIVCIVAVIVLMYLFRYTMLCSGWQIMRAVDILCELHRNGHVAGNMCHDLCVERKVKLGSCQTFHMAKDVVFEANWQGQRIMIKAHHLDINKYDSISYISNGRQHYPSLAEFSDMIKNLVRFNFNISLGRLYKSGLTILTKMWSLDFEDFSKSSPQALRNAMDSLWSLVQQNEYLLFKYFEGKEIFPKVVGTCGHFYAVEYVEPIVSVSLVAMTLGKNHIPEWLTRLQQAYGILELTEELEKSFHQPLHLCDMKMQHFGWDSKGQIKLLDVDTSFFQSVINKLVANELNCTANADCAFWDCKSQCDPIKKMCTRPVTNNNLQMVCEKVFLGLPAQNNVWLHQKPMGLLYPAPPRIKDTLFNVLSDCANPNNSPDVDTRQKAPQSVYEKIKYIILGELGMKVNRTKHS